MLQGRKLLLADDSIAIQKVIELTFEDEGMEVLSVGDGQQALERLKDVRPDIVLADVYMPGLNGYQLCELVKRIDQHIPVVLLVGSFEPFNEAEARRVGADDYLTKPFQSIRQMVSKVGSLLSGHKSESEAVQSQAEHQAQMENLELATADTAPLPAYKKSEARTESSAQPTGPFADMQLDDEMIEARPAGEFGSAEQTMRGGQPRSTESLSAQDFAEMGVKTTTTGQQLSTSGASALANEARETGAATPASSSAPPRAATNDDALLDLDEVEMPRASAMAEADDFILDLQETIRPQAAEAVEAQTVGSVEQHAEPAPLEEQQRDAGEFHFHQQDAQAPAAEPERETPYLADSSQMRDTSELSLEETPVQAEAAMTEAAAASEPSQPQGQIGLDQLSPEAVDAIARRVVEQLSTKVVEQIAWEVVPQLAELLIKRRLEEKQ